MLMRLIGDLSHSEPALTTLMVVHLYRVFLSNDMEQVINLIKSIFKTSPDFHRRSRGLLPQSHLPRLFLLGSVHRKRSQYE